ncbi:MAG: hypothetical protein VX614_06000 [Myxococcota bacterium]|nr:hypothetical protein [Myxococcota bacterium]
MADREARREDPRVVAARAGRYGELRAAQRAICTSALPNRSSPAEMLLQQARARLREVAERRREGAGSTDSTSAASEIDHLLDRAGQELRDLALATSFSQFRATLPHLRDSHPDEVAALLDLCLPAAERASQARNLCEYMITLLATEKPAGKVLIRRDPARVTPGVRELCGHAVERSDAVLDHLDALREAMAEISNPLELDDVREQLRGYKDKMGPEFWVPEVLHALVEYNVAIQNRIEDAVEADRTLDSLDTLTTPSCQSEYTFALPGVGEVPRLTALGLRPRSAGSVGPGQDRPRASDRSPRLPTAERLPTGPPAASGSPRVAREAPAREVPAPTSADLAPENSERRFREAIQELEASLAARIAQGAPGPGPGGDLVMRFDLAPLSRWERLAFTGGSDAADAAALRAAVLAGLLVRHMDEIEAPLARLGVSRGQLETAWLAHVGSEIQQAIAHALVNDAYARARELAETKSKFLYPLREGQSQAGQSVARTSSLGGSLSEPRAEAAAAPLGRATGGRPGARWWRRAAVCAGLLAAILALIGFQAYPPEGPGGPEGGGSAQELAPGALRALSPHLVSASRDGFGYGTRLFGPLSESWDAQPGERRAAAAISLGTRLQGFGVGEVLLFDARRQLRVHFRDGELLLPPVPAGRSGAESD